MTDLRLHPVDWYNLNGVFKDIFKGDDKAHLISDSEASYIDPENLDTDNINRATFKLLPTGQVSVLKSNPFGIASGIIISKFTLLSCIKYKGDFRAAESHVMYKLMEIDIPYVRIGTDYYCKEKKPDRYGGEYTTLKVWKKEAITDDHTKNIFKLIPKYQDFIISPDNKTYSSVHGRYYNLYSEFPHEPLPERVSDSDIPMTLHLLRHIFGDQFQLGIKYMKVLYEYPRQILPILVLVSEERETGKTTFLNYISMLFGDNSILINPSDLISNFNSSYSTKNIILVDEAFVEKGLGVEKLKSIATAKKMSVNPKHVQGYSVDFFGKVIMCSNKELDFMRIDDAEIRFFIRKIKSVTGKRNVGIEDDLYKEIPAFLRYLIQQPEIDFSKSRMVFTKEEIRTDELQAVKDESRSTVMKEIKSRLYRFFMNHPNENILHAMPDDIKEHWFQRDNNILSDYIRKILKNEFKLKPLPPGRYQPMAQGDRIMGRPFEFDVKDYLTEEERKARQIPIDVNSLTIDL